MMKQFMVYFAIGTAAGFMVASITIALWCFAFWVAPTWLAIRLAAAASIAFGLFMAPGER